MMRVRTDTRYRECYNSVGDIEITYNISNQSGQEAESVSIRIGNKDGKTVGNGTVFRNGRMLLSLSEEGGLDIATIKAVCDTILKDVDSVFNPQEEPS